MRHEWNEFLYNVFWIAANTPDLRGFSLGPAPEGPAEQKKPEHKEDESESDEDESDEDEFDKDESDEDESDGEVGEPHEEDEQMLKKKEDLQELEDQLQQLDQALATENEKLTKTDDYKAMLQNVQDAWNSMPEDDAKNNLAAFLEACKQASKDIPTTLDN
eukprot:g29908.t1